MRILHALRFQTLSLAVGTAFAWWTVLADLYRFFTIEGTIFRIADCAIPYPVTTPCFWGAWAFLIAMIWSVRLLKRGEGASVRSQRRLVWFLTAGTLFAWGNFTYGLISFYTAPAGEPSIGCSGQLVTNPFMTPCFYGAALFAVSLAAGFAVLVTMQKKNSPRQGDSRQ